MSPTCARPRLRTVLPMWIQAGRITLWLSAQLQQRRVTVHGMHDLFAGVDGIRFAGILQLPGEELRGDRQRVHAEPVVDLEGLLVGGGGVRGGRRRICSRTARDGRKVGGQGGAAGGAEDASLWTVRVRPSAVLGRDRLRRFRCRRLVCRTLPRRCRVPARPRPSVAGAGGTYSRRRSRRRRSRP